ncbi:MAG: hypothetical protein ACKPKO_43595, partial [Candidatus Fonsibacter sp.]
PDTTLGWSSSIFATRTVRIHMPVALACCIATAYIDPVSLNPVWRRPVFFFALKQATVDRKSTHHN